MAWSFPRAVAALLVLHLLVFPAAHAALAVSKHQLKMHLEWNRASESQDWKDWREAFHKSDTDHKGHVHRVEQIFKEHFNILHERIENNHAGLTKAEETHFREDAAHFVEFTGRSAFQDFSSFR